MITNGIQVGQVQVDPVAAVVCRGRAQEARRIALATCSTRDRACWLDVARVWDMAATNPMLRGRAVDLHRTAGEID